MPAVILMHGESQILSPEVHVHLDHTATQQLRLPWRPAPVRSSCSASDRAPHLRLLDRGDVEVRARRRPAMGLARQRRGGRSPRPRRASLKPRSFIISGSPRRRRRVGDARPNASGARVRRRQAALAKNIIPHHMEALRKVRIESPALTGRLPEQLELWFDGKAPIAMAVPPAAPDRPSGGPGEAIRRTPRAEELPAGQPSDADVGPNIIPAARRTPRATSRGRSPIRWLRRAGRTTSPRRRAIRRGLPLATEQATGRRAPSRSTTRGRAALGSRVAGNAAAAACRCESRRGPTRRRDVEPRRPQRTDRALRRGAQHQLERTQRPRRRAGRATHCTRSKGKGSALGDEVHLHRGENRLWIDGPGRLTLPVSGGMAAASHAGPVERRGGRPLRRPKEVKPLEIRRQGHAVRRPSSPSSTWPCTPVRRPRAARRTGRSAAQSADQLLVVGGMVDSARSGRAS